MEINFILFNELFVFVFSNGYSFLFPKEENPDVGSKEVHRLSKEVLLKYVLNIKGQLYGINISYLSV